MGLINKYLAEIELIGLEPAIGSTAWLHKYANRQRSSALAGEEADAAVTQLKERLKAPAVLEDLPEAELHKLVSDIIEELVIGRELEDDEEEFLNKNPDYIVIDI